MPVNPLIVRAESDFNTKSRATFTEFVTTARSVITRPDVVYVEPFNLSAYIFLNPIISPVTRNVSIEILPPTIFAPFEKYIDCADKSAPLTNAAVASWIRVADPTTPPTLYTYHCHPYSDHAS